VIPRILLLDPTGPEAAALVATATRRGYQVRGVIARSGPDGSPPPTGLVGHLLAHFADPERGPREVMDYARRIHADAVLTTNEFLTPLTAAVCAALGLPGNDPSLALAARNKIAMQDAFARSVVTAPRGIAAPNPEHALRAVTTLGGRLPWVVKPVDAAGSAGVTVVHRLDQLADAWEQACAVQPGYGMSGDPRVLVQQHVDGVEYSVESLIQDNRTTHLCITRKQVTSGSRRIEIGHSLPVHLPSTVESGIFEQTQRAITAVGIRNGAAHTEVIVRPDTGCAVIEIGARLGAGRIGFLIRHALGIDTWSALLDIALGRPANLAPTRRGYATVRFITSPRTGVLKAVDGLPVRGPQVPEAYLRVQPGAAVHHARRNGDRIGHFIVTGTSPTSVERQAQRLHAGVTVDVEPVPDRTRAEL
jgi:biotin carboxylase